MSKVIGFNVGCSMINHECINYLTAYDSTADMKTVYLRFSSDVQCVDITKTDCGCYCPIYKTDPEGEPFEPYCRYNHISIVHLFYSFFRNK